MRALALLILAACDPLLDEALAYGRRLQESGVSADMVVQPGMIHASCACRASPTGRLLPASASRTSWHRLGWFGGGSLVGPAGFEPATRPL
jgi:acetyl esterase/lipase